jgi:hypothetical protein
LHRLFSLFLVRRRRGKFHAQRILHTHTLFAQHRNRVNGTAG